MENHLLHNKEIVIMYMDQNRKLLHHYSFLTLHWMSALDGPSMERERPP